MEFYGTFDIKDQKAHVTVKVHNTNDDDSQFDLNIYLGDKTDKITLTVSKKELLQLFGVIQEAVVEVWTDHEMPYHV